jgi:hypothetical protein
MQRVSAKGLGALDKRSAGYRALAEWRSGLESDLGGVEHLSSQQKTLIEMATRHRLYLDHIDSFLMGLPSVINRRSRRALPILTTRMTIDAALQRTLLALGLKRTEHVPTIAEHFAAKEVENDESEPEPESPGLGDLELPEENKQ